MTEKNNQPTATERVAAQWDTEDVAIAEAMQRVEIPRQVTERVRTKLRALAAGEVAAFEAESVQNCGGSQRPVVLPTPARNQLWTRRRITAVSLALVASLVFLLFSLRPQPLTEYQLTQYCVEQLDMISNQVPQWKSPAPDASTRLEPLLQNLNQRLNLVGSLSLAASPLAGGCTVWKFDTGQGKNLYLLDFSTPQTIRDIPGRFRVIQQSSTSWSLAALQQGDRLLVVAIEGDIADYIKSLEWA